MGASCSFGALHKDFRDIIGAVEMDVVAGGDFDDAPEGEPAGTLHRKGDGVKLHGRAGNIGYGNAVALVVIANGSDDGGHGRRCDRNRA